MNISTDELVNGLMDEIKRLTLENVVLKATLNKMSQPSEEVKESDD